MDAAALIQYLKHQRLIIDYVYISATAIFVYDYLLTVHLEIGFIWFSRWSYTKVLFLMIRYMAFVDMLFVLYNQIYPDISAEKCEVTFPASAWLLLFQLVLAETVLGIRTWAVWRRDRTVGIGLAALMLANLVVQCIMANIFIKSTKYAPPPYPGFMGCFVTDSNRILWANYASFTVVEAIILAFMATSALRSYRQGNHGELSNVVHRDAILFYVYLLCITAANMAVVITTPPDIMTMLTPLGNILYSVFTTRIVLNIQDVGNRGQQTELHTVYHEVDGSTLPLQFMMTGGYNE